MNRNSMLTERALGRRDQPSALALLQYSPLASAVVGAESTETTTTTTSKYDFPEATPYEKFISTAGAAAGAYHGYKRNDSVGWALWWGFAGSVSPFITTAVALAQGYGKRGPK